MYDPATNLTRFGARDYDPETGRWTAKEPLGFAAATNFYVYANNDPINLIDPNGLNPYDAMRMPEPVGEALSWIRRITLFDQGGPSILPFANPFEPATRGASELWNIYKLMKRSNWKNQDEYYHCIAHCRATRHGGAAGGAWSRAGSYGREAWDFGKQLGQGMSPSESMSECSNDLVANDFGHDFANSSDTCSATCDIFRPSYMPSVNL